MRQQCIYLFFILFLFSIQTNPAQNAIINIEFDKTINVEDIFDIIKENTNYQFVYPYSLIKDSPKVKIEKGVISAKDLLKKGLSTISCTYEFKDDLTIIVKSKKESDAKKTSKYVEIITLQGTILDKRTNQPVVYANIGFLKKGIGTISDEQGHFKLNYKSASIDNNQVLQISTLGYKTLQLSTSKIAELLSKNSTLFLEPEALALDEVFITNIKRKEITLGTTRTDSTTIGYWKDKEALGGEIASKIKVRKKNTRLHDLKFNIINDASDSIKIRVNVYDYAKRYPTKKLLSQNIFHTIKKKEGLVTVDLEPYNIYVDDDFVISIELIKVYGEAIEFLVYGEKYGNTSFKRQVSQDKWERFNHLGMSFSVSASFPKKGQDQGFDMGEPEEPALITSIPYDSSENINSNKTIHGKITLLNQPLPDVNIIVKGTSRGTKTDHNGFYGIDADEGQMIQFSHIGLKTVSIIVEDVTSVLNIEMVEDVNQLDESVITVRKEATTVDELIQRRNVNLQLPVGTINPHRSGFDTEHMKGEDLNIGSPSLVSALNGKFAGVIASGTFPNQTLQIRSRPATYVLNGIAYDEEPPIPLSAIKDIFIVKGGAFVIIVPDDAPHIKKIDNEKIAEQHRNQNYYVDDAVIIENSNFDQPQSLLKTISGKITHLDQPLENVNIKIRNISKGTQTDADGNFMLKANVGDVIDISHVGYHTVTIVIEDVTNILNIDMILKNNELEEVIVSAEKTKAQELAEKAEKPVVTSRGILDPKRATYPLQFVDGEEIKPIYESLTQALAGKRAGISFSTDAQGNKRIIVKPFASMNTPVYAIWDVDGQIYELEPPIDLNNIKSVHILKTLSGTNKYGSAGAGGVVVVSTKNGTFDPVEAQRKKVAEKYTNKSYYTNDALALSDDLFFGNLSLSELEQKANSTQNPEILKSIAYQYQALDMRPEAINIYEKVYHLRPQYAQSYRDLANAYINNDQFTKGWRLYMSYLAQGHDINDEGIGRTMFSEMEYLYFNRQNQTPIKNIFQPKNETVEEFRNDVRIVVEWNTSEAEFDLEFVGPERRAYTFEHTLAANQELITHEKVKGYSSKEFIIDNIGNGEWLVNITYKGNKKPEPTFFKVTTYYHWGKSAQKRDVKVYKFEKERYKIQLLQLNKQLLIASK